MPEPDPPMCEPTDGAGRPRVVFLSGPSGAGKSTIARRLEARGMARLSFDQEAWRRGVRALPVPAEFIDPIDAALRRDLLEHVTAGRDVVLDFSFTTRALRDEWRALLTPFGIVPHTVHVATDRETALSRLASRADAHGDDFRVDPGTARRHHDTFEAPTPDEGPLTVIRD